MRILLGVLSAMLGLAMLVAGLEIGSLRGQLTAQQRQLAQVQSQVQTTISAAEQRISGTHRDLITCGDLQDLIWPVTGTDSYGEGLAATAGVGPGPVSLPAHCINQ